MSLEVPYEFVYVKWSNLEWELSKRSDMYDKL